MAEQIIDGTGGGFLAEVDNTNKLAVRASTSSDYDNQTVAGRAFNINTLFLPYALTADSALIRLRNNESQPIILVGWFIGSVGLTGAGTAFVAQVFGDVSGFSGAETSGPLVNRNVGSAQPFAIEAFRPNSAGQTLVGSAANPVLYQTQGATSRVFGNVFITVPQGGSEGVEIFGLGGAITGGEIYTGFTGYVVPST